MSNLVGPTYLTCNECKLVIPFYSSLAQCLRCGTWLQIQDSSCPSKLVIVKEKEKK